MPSSLLLAGLLAAPFLVLAGVTRVLARHVERRFPPSGDFVEIDGVPIHYIDIASGPSPDLLPMIFLHGASGNARDLMGAFGDRLKGRGRMIFIDRPGAGYSGRSGKGDASPEKQAGYAAGVLERLGVDKAVIVGHSLGAAIAAAFAVHHPDKTLGVMFIAPASHPWPGARISWYYRLAGLPVLGALFAHTIAIPFGNLKYRSVVRQVFAPDEAPVDYADRSATRLVLRPSSFLHNAADVGELHAHVKRISRRYGEIGVPAVVITGDRDQTVAADIHAAGLVRDIAGARLVRLRDTGHMPTYSATARIVGEIERLSEEIRRPVPSRRPAGRAAQMPDRPSLAT